VAVPVRKVALKLVRDRAHVDEVVERIRSAQVSVWISTANLKDVHVEAPIGTRARAKGRYMSITEVFSDLARRGVETRILHAGEPSRFFKASLATRGGEKRIGLEMRRCVRVHLKMIAIDGSLLYLGSANFTGAGIGAKGDERRNFEVGITTDDELMLDEMQGAFEDIWSGKHCASCRVRNECPLPIDMLLKKKQTLRDLATTRAEPRRIARKA
jgi:phosphatidylserine/phosphatidylglycerophosphate/cardiolipin synthase-like enzyme